MKLAQINPDAITRYAKRRNFYPESGRRRAATPSRTSDSAPERLLELLQDGPTTYAQAADLLHLPENTVGMALKRLVADGKARVVRVGKTGHLGYPTIFEALRPMQRDSDPASLVTWSSASEPPDSELTVLIHIPGDDDPVRRGYHDGSGWFGQDAQPLSGVAHWADLPEPPAINTKADEHLHRD